MTIKSIKWTGKVITKPGLYSNIPLSTYHSAKICDGPSVSSSGLRKLFEKSPAHFYDQWPGNPNYIESEDKKHFVLGRALHHLMLGEAFFNKLFAVPEKEYPDAKTGEMKPWTYQANYCKQWKLAQIEQGKAVLSRDDVMSLLGMVEALRKHPIVRDGALNGMIERSAFWRDKETGLWVKIRPDAIPTSSTDFVDLKHTPSVLWNDLQKTIGEYGYHQQGALIRQGARDLLGIPNPTFTLVFVESERPHCVRIVTPKDNELDRGEQQNRAGLDTIARCLKSGHWPGPGGEREDAEHIELPEWKQRQIDDRLQFGIA